MQPNDMQIRKDKGNQHQVTYAECLLTTSIDLKFPYQFLYKYSSRLSISWQNVAEEY